MKLTGSYVLASPREEVWGLLTDPKVLAAVTPGCERLEQQGPDEYHAVLKVGVAAVKGTYEGQIRLCDKQFPDGYTLQVQGSGAAGFVRGEVRIRLEDAEGGATRVTFDGDAEVGGLVAGVGQRMLEGVAKFLVGEFFKRSPRC